ncbi:MAG: 2-oxo acid dehydrogenase subunit E2 [Gammaproteobacteria bacterium]|nr:2-oxo acid dehydrogenase subunit E2 [Gammaproteobacteria bacterium]
MLERDSEDRVIRQTVPLSRVRQTIAERLTHGMQHYPQGTGMVVVDAGALVRFRQELKERGVSISFGDLFVKAAANALTRVPELNASRGESEIVYYRSVNIGMMADINGNLMAPVISETQSKTVEQVAVELRQTYDYLKRGKLMRVKLDGATFSISNLGMFPMDGFTPLLSPPQGGILGVGRIRRVPGFNDAGNVVPRDEVTLSITTDHGLVDGIHVAKFLQALIEAISDPWHSMYKTGAEDAAPANP